MGDSTPSHRKRNRWYGHSGDQGLENGERARAKDPGLGTENREKPREGSGAPELREETEGQWEMA